MSLREWAMVVLLVAGVGICLWSCLGLFVLRDEWGRLHALGPAGTLGALCICAAAVLKEGLSLQGAVKPVLLLLFLWSAGPVMTHAVARALYAKQRDTTGVAPERRQG